MDANDKHVLHFQIPIMLAITLGLVFAYHIGTVIQLTRMEDTIGRIEHRQSQLVATPEVKP